MTLEKTFHANFPLGPSSLPVVVAQSDKRLANKTAKRVSCVDVADIRRLPGSYERTNDCYNMTKEDFLSAKIVKLCRTTQLVKGHTYDQSLW